MAAWRTRLPWLLLAALVAAAVALAASYSCSFSYSLAWSASYAASSAPTQYAQYSLTPFSSWVLSLMPWYSKANPMWWAASWSMSLMPAMAAQKQVSWYARWSAWPVIVYSYPGGQTITVEPEVSVSVAPLGGAWRGYVDLSGSGWARLSLPPGVELVPLGGLALSGASVYVNGSGRLLQRVNCYLVSVANAQGQAVAASAVFNGTKLAVGSSTRCIIGVSYDVEVPGYKVANVRVNGARFYLPLVLSFLNTTDYYLDVVVADPTVIIITSVSAQPTAAGYVQVAVRGYVYDNMTGYRIPGGQVTLYYNGVPYDVAVTGSDGGFVAVMTERLSGPVKLRVEFAHPDYQPSSTYVELSVAPGGAGAVPGAELPATLWVAAAVALVFAVVLAAVMVRRARARALAAAGSEWLE